MKLDVLQLTLGPMGNNVYLLGDRVSKDAVVIDPSYEADVVMTKVKERGWTLRQIWLTHAHFDHIAGADRIARSFKPPLLIGLHPDDEHWYQQEGGAGQFGMSIPQPPPTDIHFEHGMGLTLGGDQKEFVAEVRHAPGHSPGHVMFYCEPLGILLCGDVIFREGIGRTDLLGGDYASLLRTIRDEVLSLPDETRLLPGHGQETSVGYEREHNPFLM